MLRPLLLFATYATWMGGCRLVVLTLVTYVFMATGGHIQEISEVLGSNEVIVAAFASTGFVTLVRLLFPLSAISQEVLLDPERIEKRFIPGFLRGSVIMAAITCALLITDSYEYLGLLVNLDNFFGTFGIMALRTAALVAFVFCEEYLFRGKIQGAMLKRFSPAVSVAITSIAYCGIKTVLFELGTMQYLTLFLFSWLAGLIAIRDEDYGYGAGMLSGLFVVGNVILGLPVLGNEFSGVVLLRLRGDWIPAQGALSYYLTGGVGGPLSGFVLQLVLLVQIAVVTYRMRNTLLVFRRKLYAP